MSKGEEEIRDRRKEKGKKIEHTVKIDCPRLKLRGKDEHLIPSFYLPLLVKTPEAARENKPAVWRDACAQNFQFPVKIKPALFDCVTSKRRKKL